MRKLNSVRRTVLALVLCSAVFGALGPGVALAGEVTGTGESLKPLHGMSECAFSGLNDTYSGDPDVPDADGFFRTQSWGQIPKADRDFLVSIGVMPGTACNPHLAD